jgi:hypothetical protein
MHITEGEAELIAQANALRIHPDCLESLLEDPDFEIPEDTQQELARQTKSAVQLWRTGGGLQRSKMRRVAIRFWWSEECVRQTMTAAEQLMFKRLNHIEAQLDFLTDRFERFTDDRQ